MIVMAVGMRRVSGRALVGELWAFEVSVTDLDGDAVVTETPTVTVTPPSGAVTTPAVTSIRTGVWRFTTVPALPGRYILAAATASFGMAAVTGWADPATTSAGMPVIADWQNYAGGDLEFSWTDDEIGDALQAEAAAQRARLRQSALFTADVRQALMRRVTCNLARRRLPLGVQTGDADMIVIPTNDPEVRRLEAPYRKLVVG